MTPDKHAAGEAVFNRFQRTPQHILLDGSVTISVPYLDVVVIRLNVVEVVGIHEELQNSVAVKQGDTLLFIRLDRSIADHIGIIHEPDGIVLVYKGEIQRRYQIRNAQPHDKENECPQKNSRTADGYRVYHSELLGDYRKRPIVSGEQQKLGYVPDYIPG